MNEKSRIKEINEACQSEGTLNGNEIQLELLKMILRSNDIRIDNEKGLYCGCDIAEFIGYKSQAAIYYHITKKKKKGEFRKRGKFSKSKLVGLTINEAYQLLKRSSLPKSDILIGKIKEKAKDIKGRNKNVKNIKEKIEETRENKNNGNTKETIGKLVENMFELIHEQTKKDEEEELSQIKDLLINIAQNNHRVLKIEKKIDKMYYDLYSK